MPLRGRRVTVLGGGIAGLAAARALALRGAEVTVIEQAPELAEVGAGIQIGPNGARALAALGLAPALERAGLRAEAVELRDAAGRRVLRMPLDRASPAWRFLHRADLIDLLAEGARAAGVRFRLGCRIARVEPGEDGARLHPAEGPAERTELLVAADGIQSVARPALEGRIVPHFTLQAAWRALVPARGDEAPVATVYMGPGRHLVTYPLRGGRLVNIVAVEERFTWAAEGWHHPDDPAHLSAAFARFGPPVRALLERVEDVHLWGLFRHPVARRWHDRGRVVLIGDAAHPTLPFLAQGANLALEDAVSLAACLDAGEDPAAALDRWQAVRAPRAERAIAAAAGMARAYHLRPAALRAAVHAALRLVGLVAPRLPLGRLAWLHEHDAARPV
jgi:salicylate hydroxylase